MKSGDDAADRRLGIVVWMGWTTFMRCISIRRLALSFGRDTEIMIPSFDSVFSMITKVPCSA